MAHKGSIASLLALIALGGCSGGSHGGGFAPSAVAPATSNTTTPFATKAPPPAAKTPSPAPVAASPAPPTSASTATPTPKPATLAGAGTSHDLGGTWRAKDGSEVLLAYTGSGRHDVSGTIVGSGAVTGVATVGSDLSTGDAWVDFTIAGTTDRYLAARDRTALQGSKRTFERQVPKGFVRLRVMQYNMEGADQMSLSHLQQVAQFVLKEAPDVVCIEECKALNLFGFSPLNQAGIIAHYLGWPYEYGSDRRPGPIDEGEAVFVRPSIGKITSRTSVALKTAVPDPHDPTRQALVCDVLLAGPQKHVQVIGTHTSSKGASQQLEFAAIVALAKGPGVVLGDFNTFKGSPKSILAAKLCDAWPAANPGQDGFTIPSFKPDQRIDYVWVARDKTLPGDGGRVLACWCDAEPGALCSGKQDDHRPVIAVVELATK